MKLNRLFTDRIPIRTYSKLLLADMDTPVSSYARLNGAPNSFLLESMEGVGNIARYSIIGLKPLLTFKRFPDQTIITNPATGEHLTLHGDPFEHLKSLLKAFAFDLSAPFESGILCGYLSYDTIRYIEEIPDVTLDDLHLPEMSLILPAEVVLFDNFTHTQKLLVHVEGTGNSAEMERDAAERLDAMIAKLAQPVQYPKELASLEPASQPDVNVNMTNDDYFDHLERAKAYIRNGDIFQVVFSRRFQTAFAKDPFEVYRMLRLINPSPYMFYLNLEDVQLVGASPETLVKYDGDRVLVRPIAGTRKRGKNAREDQAIAQELLQDEKELAEHHMLVDLGRNDIGRVARYGSVRVDTLRKVEYYSHVMHIVSTVTGELRENYDAVDVFKACFPAGTVSGAPKIRAMEIIDELEPTRRGPYAGAVGHFDFNGQLDTCIAIRTAWFTNQQVYWQAGGGIVADSVPEHELMETENKARALMKAVALAKEVAYDRGH